MYELMVEDSFSAAHQLRGYKGKCENLHGHTFKVQVFIKGEKLDNTGMMMDFHEIKAELKKAIADFDHSYLNDLSFFKEINPTSENLARVIFDKLKKALPSVTKVTVWESPTAAASYSS